MILRTICVVILLTVLPQSTEAQSKQDDFGQANSVFQSRDEYHAFFGSLKALRDPEINAMLPALNDMIIGSNRSSEFGDSSFGTGLNGIVGLLSDKNIRREIEMVDQQYQELTVASGEIHGRVVGQIRTMQLDNPREFVEELRQLRSNSETDLEDLLLPHQLKRLRQIALRLQIQRRGLINAITKNPLASELGIDTQQKLELKESARKIQEELEREIQKLRAGAERKLIAELGPKQRRKLDDLLGDSIDFSILQQKKSAERDRKGKRSRSGKAKQSAKK